MKKQLMFGLLTLMGTYAANAQYGFAPPVGITTVNTLSSPATINLTPATIYNGYQAGAIWNYNTVDFNHSFAIEYDANVDISYGTGADGFCAVFKQAPGYTSIGNTAGYLGYYGGPDFLSNSFGIEFDDYDNGSSLSDPSPYYDHIMIAQNGDYTSPNIIGGPVSILSSGATIKDSKYHHYTIEWLCGSNTLNVRVDGENRLSTTSFDYRSLFTNPAAVTWGFTGGIGSSGSNHILKNVVLKSGEVCAQPCIYKPNASVSTSASGLTQIDLFPSSANVLIAGYIWDFGDGTSPLTTTSLTVTHGYTNPGTYTVIVTILGYNSTTGECCPYTYETKIDVSGEKSAKMPNGDVDKATDFEVFPNPTTGKINITAQGFKFTSVKIFDINGHKVADTKTEATGNKQIDLNTLGKGLYILQLSDESGVQHTGKISLQN